MKSFKVVLFVVLFFAMLGVVTPLFVNELGTMGFIALPFVWLAFVALTCRAFNINLKESFSDEDRT